MLNDILTVMRKELAEAVHTRSRRGGLISIAMVVGVLGVFMPLVTGREWVTSSASPLSFAWLPLFLAVGMVADAFAGERERHTLETLLASRLPDQAILFGKVAAAVGYSFGISATGLLLGGVTANLASLDQGFIYYPVWLIVVVLGATLLLSALLSAVGVLVSLRASTVRQAYQRVSFSLLGVWVLAFVLLRFLPESARQTIAAALSGVDWGVAGALTAAALLGLTVALFAVATARFRRSRLILG